MSGGSQPSPEKPALYSQGNDAVRVDNFCELDDAVEVALRSFFRKIGAPHLFEERVAPTLRIADSSIFAAVRDRPWPPWGNGARKIIAMIQVHPISGSSFGLSPVYVRPEEASNIGLRAALYKETLEALCQRCHAEINYLAIEGSILADRVLSSAGFKRTDDLVQTEDARYFFYRADAQTVLDNLQLSRTSLPELLAHKVDQNVLERSVIFQAALEWGRYREIIAIDGGSFDASLPGGVPPSPPTAGIDIGNLGDIINPGT